MTERQENSSTARGVWRSTVVIVIVMSIIVIAHRHSSHRGACAETPVGYCVGGQR